MVSVLKLKKIVQEPDKGEMINPLPSLSNVPLRYATFEDLLSECTGRIQEYAAELALTLPLRLRAS